jgi:orotate phosphoribosyltransferase
VKKKADKSADNGIVIPVPPPPADKKQNDQQLNAYKKQAEDADKRAKAAEQRATSSENTVVRINDIVDSGTSSISMLRSVRSLHHKNR